jgi:thymidylate synthase (FAD)
MNELLEVIENEATLKKEHLNKEIKILDKGFVRLVDFMGTDASIVQAARVSYGKGTTKRSRDRDLIRYLMRMRHTSPFEMVEFKFHCKMPVVCARQWIRHRTASVSEYSGRYSEMIDECYIPELKRIQGQDSVNHQASDGEQVEEAVWIRDHMEEEQKSVFENYRSYLESGTAREMARINLPLSTYTQWYWKMDLHNLFHFLKLRMDSHAQWEMQQYANAIFELIKPIVPVSCEAFEDYVLKAVTFSKQEMEIIKDFPQNIEELRRSVKKLSKLEKQEFIRKIEREI